MSAGLWGVLCVAGGAGAMVRLVVGTVFERHRLPWGTFAVNMGGAFVLGMLAGAATAGRVTPGVLWVVGTGFCGALTTFSTFTVDTLRLALEGDARGAALNVIGSVACGLSAAGLGLGVAYLVW